MDEIVDENVPIEDLKKYGALYEKQVKNGAPTSKASFDYAHCLIRSTRQNVKMGIELLEYLLQKDDDDVQEKRDYIFYLAIAYTRIKEYDKALNAVEAGLRVEPTNNQFLSLKQLIISRRKIDALKGLAIVGGVSLFGGAAIVGGLVALARMKK